MKWIKRNWLTVLATMCVLSTWPFYRDWATAHAQKPEPQSRSGEVYLENSTLTGEVRFVINGSPLFLAHEDGSWEVGPALWRQIESHCIAILPEETMFGGAHPEQTLKLRCGDK